MTKEELDALRFNLRTTIAYLAGDTDEPDDAPDQYCRAVSKALHTLEQMYGELVKLRNCNAALAAESKDKVDVIRCKYCKHWYKDEVCHVCALTGDLRKADWFCCDGERRSDNG